MQNELLDKVPEADLAVYAVWFEMVGGDSRSRWPEDLLTDPRVMHFWDDRKALGRWYGRHPDYGGSTDAVVWDAYLLYRSGAAWGDDGPSQLESWGRTIVQTREGLRRDLLSLLEAAP